MPAGDTASARPLEARFQFTGPLDLRLTMAPLGHGRADFTGNFGVDGIWLARRTATGPAGLCIWVPTGEEAVRAAA